MRVYCFYLFYTIIISMMFLSAMNFSLPSSKPAGRTPLVNHTEVQPVTFEEVRSGEDPCFYAKNEGDIDFQANNWHCVDRSFCSKKQGFEDILDAIEFVESGNRPSVTGDGGKAVGAYQIWPVYLRDANRISGRHYTLQDRLDRDKSREMTRIVLTHYGKDVPLDKIAAIHISPSNRDLDRPAAVEYLRKINNYLEAKK
jgi:hypothetical protein